jgi:hypothetical protein
MTVSKAAIFGGVYSNHLALAAAIEDARRRGVQDLFCLGDLGAFGPHPDKIFPLLIDAGVSTILGNYDDSIARNLDDCQCGYTDPADNHFARISYRYTYANTSRKWRAWLGGLPGQARFSLGSAANAMTAGNLRPRRVLCCHGSPRRMNEFLWESTSPTHLLEKFCDEAGADIIVATHTGLPWTRRLGSGRLFVNCGVLGRPANDGTTCVGYTLLDAARPDPVSYVRVEYDHHELAREMRQEDLPEPFIQTILTGWWTTCLEILPAKERARGKF